MAIRGVYEAKTATLNIAEKNALLRILKWYANAAKREVDWDQVREFNCSECFCSTCRILMEKTTAELNHHAENVAIEYDRSTQKSSFMMWRSSPRGNLAQSILISRG